MNSEVTHQFNGRIVGVKTVPTQTGRTMVVFTLSGKKCKAFGEAANLCAKLDGEEIHIEAKEGSFRGEKEFAVVSVNATVNGHDISAQDTRTIPAQKSTLPTG